MGAGGGDRRNRAADRHPAPMGRGGMHRVRRRAGADQRAGPDRARARPWCPSVVLMGFFQRHVRRRRHRLHDGAGGRRSRRARKARAWVCGGAAQAIAAGFGGLLGAAAGRLPCERSMTDPSAFGTVFVLEAMLYIASAVMAVRIMDRDPTPRAGRRGLFRENDHALRCRRCGGWTLGCHGRRRPRAVRPQGRADRPRGTDQALRRCHPRRA